MRVRPAAALFVVLLATGCLNSQPGGAGRNPLTTSGLATATTTVPIVISGLDSPVGLTNAGDGSGRLFVLEQAGTIRIVKAGKLSAAPFLDIRAIVQSGGEQGLLGLAFPPNYESTGRFYVHFTAKGGDTAIARYKVDASNPDKADAGSGKIILTAPGLESNHNGGQLAFGPDGYLYIGLGDGGGAGDLHGVSGNGQDRTTILGKILRIDVKGDAYDIPSTNPFTGAGERKEIWAYGLRNPWRFSFDRATGDLYIGDVGQDKWEEIDFQPRDSHGGENYGWRVFEGRERYQFFPTTAPGHVEPVAVYANAGEHCSVTGGYVYRGSNVPAMKGVYVFGDYCSGQLWSLTRQGAEWKMETLYDTDVRISSFGEDEAGEVYIVGHGGTIHQFRPRE